MSTQAIKTKLSHTHRAIMQFMVEFPGADGQAIADHFGYSSAYISLLINSDLFRMELRYWQDIGMSEAVLGVREQVEDLAKSSLARLQERVTTLGNSIPIDSLVDISELALKSLGFGSPKMSAVPAAGPVFQTQINNFGSSPVDAKLLASARERMRTINVQRDGNSNDDSDLEVGELKSLTDQSSTGPGFGGNVQTSLAEISR